MGAKNFALPSYEHRERCSHEIWEQQFRKELTEDQLIECIDVMAYPEGGWVRDVGDYQAELTRRETERQSRHLEWLTWALVALTVVIAVATIALYLRE
jgi:hypothetical protein